MYRNHTVAVVIPAYNEEGFVGDVMREIPEYVDRVFVIEDESTDETWNEILSTANELAAKKDNTASKILADGGALIGRAEQYERIGKIDAIKHSENRGLGGSLKTGYLAALEEEEIDIIAKVDGDGQMDLDQLPDLLDPIVDGEADYAKGNRLLYSKYRADMPTFRFIGNSILTFLTKIASGYWKMMDPQNGYTAISRYALENVGIQNMYEYYGYCNDLLVKLNAKGMQIADVAMPAVYGDEESSIKYGTYIRKVSIMLLRNFFWRLKVKYLALDFHPLALFYLFGIATSVVGLLSGTWAIYARVALGDALFLRGIGSLMLFSMGSMFIMFAMLFDMQNNEGMCRRYTD